MFTHPTLESQNRGSKIWWTKWKKQNKTNPQWWLRTSACIQRECRTAQQIIKLNSIVMYIILHPKEQNILFFPCNFPCKKLYGTFPKVNHVLGHKRKFDNFKRIQIMQSVFSDHNEIKKKSGRKKKGGNLLNMWKLNTDLNNPWVKKSQRK